MLQEKIERSNYPIPRRNGTPITSLSFSNNDNIYDSTPENPMLLIAYKTLGPIMWTLSSAICSEGFVSLFEFVDTSGNFSQRFFQLTVSLEQAKKVFLAEQGISFG